MDGEACATEDGKVELRVRPLVAGVTAAAAGFVVLAAQSSRANGREVLLVLTLPLAFAIAGLVAVDRQPRSVSAAALLAAGGLHLLSFSLAAGAVIAGRRGIHPLAAAAAGLSTATFLLGLVALVALALALPSRPVLGPRQRRLLAVLAFVGLLLPLAGAVLGADQRLVLALTGWPDQVAGGGLAPHLGGLTALAAPLLTAPAVAALIVVVRYRTSTGVDRRRLRWPAAGFAFVGAALVAQLLLGPDLPGELGSLFFVAALATTPFALLPAVIAGPVDDERLAAAVRTALAGALIWTAAALAYGGVTAGTGLAQQARTTTALAVVLLCGLAPLVPQVRRAVHRVADRLALGPQVDGYVLLREYGDALARPTGLQALCGQTAQALTAGLRAPWAEMRLTSGEGARSAPGRSDAPQALRVAIDEAGTELGWLTCGRRRRGPYGPHDATAVESLARQTALAVRNHRLGEELRQRLDDLAASRQRLALAADLERRRIERDLHDGTQQDLVALLSRVELARTVLGFSVDEAARNLDELRDEVVRAIAALRRTVLGIHPPVLTDRGLVAAVVTRASELPLDVGVHAGPGTRERRFRIEVEATAYYVVVESLTNVLKHAEVREATVYLDVADEALVVEVRDEGRGGASPSRGTGLAGLADRVAAVDGVLGISSPTGGGTSVQARLPLTVPAPSRT